MHKKIAITLFIVVGFILSGCRDDAALIKTIQTNFDKYNPSGKRAFCLYVGPRIDFPYTTKNTNEKEIDPFQTILIARSRDNETLNARLALFSQQGLFTQQLITPAEAAPYGKAIYRYDVTDKGKPNLIFFKDTIALCFGKRIITGIIKDRKNEDNWGNTLTSISFSYQVENIPDWVKAPDVLVDFGSVMESFGIDIDGENSHGTLTFNKYNQIVSGPSGMWIFGM